MKNKTKIPFFKPLLMMLAIAGLGIFSLLGFRAVQTPEADYTIHSKYLYHFTKYFEWPEDRQSGPFIIGVYSNHELYLSLKSIADKKKVGNRNLLVMEFNPDDDPQNCHMLFIGRPALRFMDKIILKTAAKPILILTDKNGYIRKGSDINFLVKDEMLRFELSSSSVESKHIKVANQIKELSLPVN